MLEWVVISLSRGSSRTKDWTWVSCISCFDRQILYLGGIWATWEAPHHNTTAQTLNGFPFHWEEKSDPSQWIPGPWHCCPAPLLSPHPANPATWPPLQLLCLECSPAGTCQAHFSLTFHLYHRHSLRNTLSATLFNCNSCFPPTFLLIPLPCCFPPQHLPLWSSVHIHSTFLGPLPLTWKHRRMQFCLFRALPGTQWGWVKMLQESSEELPDPVRNTFPMAWGLETVPLKQHSFILCSLSLPSLRGGEVSSSPSGRALGESQLLLQRWSHLQVVPISWKQWKQWQTLFSWAPKSLLVATHSSVLAWRIPGTGEPGGLSSMGSHRVGHDWSDLAAAKSLRMVTAAMKLKDACFLEEKLW